MNQLFYKSKTLITKGSLVLLMVLFGINTNAQEIKGYSAFYSVGKLASDSVIVIRKFEQIGHIFYIGVNPDKLETQIIPDSLISIKPLSWEQIQDKFKNTAYIKAIKTAKEESYSLQNAGITHGFPNEKGITLTIDLCPSKKPLDRTIFTSLISEFNKIETPIPIALSITGRFMLSHPDDIKWIKELISKNQISVTWINHSYNHRYNPQAPLIKNFLLEPNTNLRFEILQTEIELLQNNLISSVFFRFPGLVSKPEVVDSVINYGLIPIGSDAWLGKGQKSNDGSIVLIHGNGNEPIGVKAFIKLIQSEKAEVMKKEWLMYDLRESIEEKFQ